MKFRGLDAAQDWMLGQGLGSYAREEAALALDIATRIRSWYGNCFFDKEAGIDWLNRMNKGQLDNLLLELQTVILQTDGTVKINTFNATLATRTRHCVVSYDIQTIFSPSFRKQLDIISQELPNA